MAIQDHNLKMSEQAYRDLELPSYSMLASIDKQGIDVVGGVKTSFNFKFGSLVDMMCFEPHRVEDTFHKGVSPKPPTTNVKKICDLILDGLDGIEGQISETITPLGRRKERKISASIKQYEKDILSASTKLDVYKGYRDQRTIDTVVKAGADYFKDRIKCRGKILIKPEMWDQCAHTAATLITHPFTAKYFAQNVPGIEIIYQYKFDTIVNGRRCKGMLDCLVVNHNEKLIFPIDLKTGEEPCKSFPMLYAMHKYYIQGGLYREALKSIVDVDFELMGYDVREFEYVYISKLNPNKPMRFKVTEDMHTAALNGFVDRYGYKHRGVHELLEEYYYSVENDNAAYTEDEMNSKGMIEMDVELILGK